MQALESANRAATHPNSPSAAAPSGTGGRCSSSSGSDSAAAGAASAAEQLYDTLVQLGLLRR